MATETLRHLVTVTINRENYNAAADFINIYKRDQTWFLDIPKTKRFIGDEATIRLNFDRKHNLFLHSAIQSGDDLTVGFSVIDDQFPDDAYRANFELFITT